jgi:hypothetical protein
MEQVKKSISEIYVPVRADSAYLQWQCDTADDDWHGDLEISTGLKKNQWGCRSSAFHILKI